MLETEKQATVNTIGGMWIDWVWTALTIQGENVVDELTLDTRLKYWVLLPISIVMVLAGIMRQYVMNLLTPSVKGTALVKLTENQYVLKAQVLLGNSSGIDEGSFQMRRENMAVDLGQGKHIAQTNSKPGEVVNPFSDPNMSDAMMNMAKGNMANFIPQTILMWWVNHFFAGFVLMKLPFPLTVRFKEMLQSGVMTADLDVRWVSSISWYFISVLGLNPVYNLMLTEPEEDQLGIMQQQPDQVMDGPGAPQPDAVMKGLANDLTIAQHESCFDNIEARVLKMYS